MAPLRDGPRSRDRFAVRRVDEQQRVGLFHQFTLCGAPDEKEAMEVGFTLQSTVGVFAPRACAVEIGATHFLTACCSRRRRAMGTE